MNKNNKYTCNKIIHLPYRRSSSFTIPRISSTWSVSKLHMNWICIAFLIAFITSTSTTLIPTASSLSIDPINHQPNTSPQQLRFPFRSFSFAPNNVCINPNTFFCDNHLKSSTNNESKTNQDEKKSTDQTLEFTMRNVPGDGDCMFLAVALATSTSMGLGANNALLNAVADETRGVVAQILATPKGHLHVDGKRIVKVRTLLMSAAASENVTMEKYIELLKNGTLQGGGPELTVLSNVLRRPISIYELDIDDDGCDIGDNNQKEISIQDDESSSSIPSRCKIKCVGTFGDLFKDPCAEIPDPAVISGLLPGAYSWHIHLIILDAGPNEKHACALLPRYCYV